MSNTSFSAAKKVTRASTTLKVLIERQVAGYPRYRQMWLNDEPVEADHYLSRKLTHTTDEGGSGIFNRHSTFYRDDLTVDIDFGSYLSLSSQPDAESFIAELQRRIAMVYEAFDAKYPAMHSEKEVELSVNQAVSTERTAPVVDCN